MSVANTTTTTTTEAATTTTSTTFLPKLLFFKDLFVRAVIEIVVFAWRVFVDQLER